MFQISTLPPPLRSWVAAPLRGWASSPFIRSLGAMGSAQLAMRVSRLATTVLLTRLLSPADFGLAAVVLTVYELVALFTRNGISAKVVQASPDELDRVAATAQNLTWVVCGALVLVQLAIAVPFARLYGDESLALPIALMALIYLATPLCNIQGAMLQREGRLNRIALAGGVQVVVDNILTAILAALGFGMWAIVLPKLLVAPIWVVYLRYGHAWRPSRQPGGAFAGWRPIASFSRHVLGVEILTTAQANVDNLIVGYCLGIEALGVYYFAFNAGLGITLGLVNSFGVAVYPHLAAVRSNRAALAARFRQSRQTLGFIVVPLVLAQTLLAPLYVPIIFGAKWHDAIPVLMLICLSALPRPFASATSQLLKAVGRPDVELRWQLRLTLVLLPALLLGTQFGVLGVAAAVLAVQGLGLTAYAIRAPRPFLEMPQPVIPRATAEARFTVVNDPDALAALQPEWDALFARAEAPHACQGFAWNWAGWTTTGASRHRRLHVLVMREAGEVVLIWPLTLQGQGRFTIARPLGAESTEYSNVLVAAGALPRLPRRAELGRLLAQPERQYAPRAGTPPPPPGRNRPCPLLPCHHPGRARARPGLGGGPQAGLDARTRPGE